MEVYSQCFGTTSRIFPLIWKDLMEVILIYNSLHENLWSSFCFCRNACYEFFPLMVEWFFICGCTMYLSIPWGIFLFFGTAIGNVAETFAYSLLFIVMLLVLSGICLELGLQGYIVTGIIATLCFNVAVYCFAYPTIVCEGSCFSTFLLTFVLCILLYVPVCVMMCYFNLFWLCNFPVLC